MTNGNKKILVKLNDKHPFKLCFRVKKHSLKAGDFLIEIYHPNTKEVLYKERKQFPGDDSDSFSKAFDYAHTCEEKIPAKKRQTKWEPLTQMSAPKFGKKKSILEPEIDDENEH